MSRGNARFAASRPSYDSQKAGRPSARVKVEHTPAERRLCMGCIALRRPLSWLMPRPEGPKSGTIPPMLHEVWIRCDRASANGKVEVEDAITAQRLSAGKHGDPTRILRAGHRLVEALRGHSGTSTDERAIGRDISVASRWNDAARLQARQDTRGARHEDRATCIRRPDAPCRRWPRTLSDVPIAFRRARLRAVKAPVDRA